MGDALKIPAMPDGIGSPEAQLRSLYSFAVESIRAWRLLNAMLANEIAVVSDNGRLLNPRVLTAGSGITLTEDETDKTLTIAASGGGGGGNGTIVTVDFGVGKTDVTVTVTGQTWVDSGTSAIVATLTDGPAGRVVEEGMIEELTWGVDNLIDGTGFDLTVHSPNGNAYGEFNFFVVGV